ncbi:MAG: VapE domain-containing protein [Hyphomonadaceae bacterium]
MNEQSSQPALARVLLVLGELGYTFGRNRRASRFTYSMPGKTKRLKVTEKTHARFRRILLEKTETDFGAEVIRDAIKLAGYQDEYDPVLKWIDGLKWDGTPRLEKLLSYYFGASDTALNRALSALTLVSAIRRARKPGCRSDDNLILAGGTGVGKTLGVRILARRRAWYSDADILGRTPERQLEALDGVWIYEIAELVGNSPLHHERNKAFLSRTVDRGRRAYGHERDDKKRACIFIGTTDKEEFFFDSAGNRRFHPVRVTKVRRKKLKADREQIWAEAAHLEKTYGPLVLPKELWENAAEQQRARLETDPWIDTLKSIVGRRKGDLMIVRNCDVLAAVGLDAAHQRPADFKRGAAVMRQLGYNHWQGKLDGERVRGFSKHIESESGE